MEKDFILIFLCLLITGTFYAIFNVIIKIVKKVDKILDLEIEQRTNKGGKKWQNEKI